MTNSGRIKFAARLREALAEAGHAQTQLKELGVFFGVTGQAVRKWLNEESCPSSSRAGEVALKLGVRRAWLLDGEPPMRSLRMSIEDKPKNYAIEKEAGLTISADEYRLLNNYRNLPRSLQLSFDTILEKINSELGVQKKRGLKLPEL